MSNNNERQVAVDAVVRACGLCTAVQQSLVSEETLAKKDKSPVTVADFGVQAVVTADLTENTSALFVIGTASAPAPVIGALQPFKGKVYQTTLDPEDEAQVQAALEKESQE